MDQQNIEIQENIVENEKKTESEVPKDQSRKRKHKKLKKKDKKGTDDEEETTEKRKEQKAVNKPLRDNEKDDENKEEVNEDGENTAPKNHKADKRRRKRGKSKKRKKRDDENSEENEEDEENEGEENLMFSDAVKTIMSKANRTSRERKKRKEERSSRKARDDEESDENNENVDDVSDRDKLSSDDEKSTKSKANRLSKEKKRRDGKRVPRKTGDDEESEENNERVDDVSVRDKLSSNDENKKAGKQRRERKRKTKKRKKKNDDYSDEEDEDTSEDESSMSSDAGNHRADKQRQRRKGKSKKKKKTCKEEEDAEEDGALVPNVAWSMIKAAIERGEFRKKLEEGEEKRSSRKMENSDDEDAVEEEEKENSSDSSDYNYDSEDEVTNVENKLRWISSDDDEIVKYKDGDIQDHKNIKDKIYECDKFAGNDIKEAYEGDKIKEGQRVVLSSEYEEKNRIEKKRVGVVGTIIKVEEDTVRVLWDNKKTEETFNTSGDLLLLDNAQTGAIHNGYKCNGCKENPIRGMKWSCCICDDIHLCTKCYMQGTHSLCHEFERKLYQKSKSIKVGIRNDDFEDKIFKYVKGIFPGAEVSLRNDEKAIGIVDKLTDKKVRMFNCDAFVRREIDNKDEVRYRVGREGHVDLKFLTPGKGLEYYEDHLQTISLDDAIPGMRVVAKNKTAEKEQVVGTIIMRESQSTRFYMPNLPGMVQESSGKVMKLKIQWDDGNIGNEIENDLQILLYDNSQIGTEHRTRCHECKQDIKGMRWKCKEKEYSLCTSCYMSDKGDTDCIFIRVIDPFHSKELSNSRLELGLDRKTQAIGLFKDAEVSEIGNDQKIGKISRISKYKINACQSQVHVKWCNGYIGKNYLQITELMLRGDSKEIIYLASHLPKVQKDLQGYVKIARGAKQITVDLWFDEGRKPQILQEKRLPYFLFENDVRGWQGDEMKSLSERTELPILLIAKKVLFFKNIGIVHPLTEKSTIKKLLLCADGVVRGNTDDKESLIGYFQRLAEAHCGCILIPVVVSLDYENLREETVENVIKDTIPVIFFEGSFRYASVSLFEENDHEDKSVPKMETVFDFEIKTPWKVKQIKNQLFFNNPQRKRRGSLSIMDYFTYCWYSDIDETFDATVCCMLIAVSMNERIQKTPGDFKENYSNALTMYLLKRGKWTFPIDLTENFFSHRSIEYIFEKNLTGEFEKSLWLDLKKSTKNAYKPPVWNRNEKKLDLQKNDLIGFLFLALLTRDLYTGAMQSLKTGYVNIHYILIGCVILQKAADDWKSNEKDKESLLELKRKLTIHALRIINCIHENDKETDRVRRLALEHDRKEQSICNILNNFNMRRGKTVQHAGRLLLNHGYLKDGIRTKNKIFLENNVVKNILNHVWYGGGRLNAQRRLCFLLLTVFHFIFLPILMITMERRPFKWFYRQYQVPFMKVCLNVVSHLALLLGYAYMLLFDFDKGISITDLCIILWMANFFADEMKQMIVARLRRKLTQYLKDKWNILDWLSMIIYMSGMLVKLRDEKDYLNASKVLLVTTYILLCVRILHMFSLSELLGPKLVMIQKMFVDTRAFMTIMFVILMCFNVAYYSILYGEKSEFTYDEIQKILGNGYWILFGELNLNGDKLKVPECTLNHTVYSNGDMERCPSALGTVLAPYVKAFYVLVTVVLLLNLLIAMYSHTFSKVHEKSTVYWSQLQSDFLDELGVKTIFPVHMALLSILFFTIHALAWLICEHFAKCCKSRSDKTEQKQPMFIRVFLCDNNYDKTLDKTTDVESRAAHMTSRELNIAEDDVGITDEELKALEEKIKKKGKNLKAITVDPKSQ